MAEARLSLIISEQGSNEEKNEASCTSTIWNGIFFCRVYGSCCQLYKYLAPFTRKACDKKVCHLLLRFIDDTSLIAAIWSSIVLWSIGLIVGRVLGSPSGEDAQRANSFIELTNMPAKLYKLNAAGNYRTT